MGDFFVACHVKFMMLMYVDILSSHNNIAEFSLGPSSLLDDLSFS